MWSKPCLAALLAALTMATALAADRPFPANSKRAKMTPGYYPDITLDGKARQLAAGARIFNEDNRIEMPAALRGSEIVVNYTEDGMGYVNQVWILSKEEAAQPAPAADK